MQSRLLDYRVFLAIGCALLTVSAVLPVAELSASADVLNGVYAACGCGWETICKGSTTACPNEQECSPSGSQCSSRYQYHETSNCVDGPLSGTCDDGQTVDCWEQYKCMCEDSWGADYCTVQGAEIASDDDTKHDCDH